MVSKSIIGATFTYLLLATITPAFGSVIYSYSGNNFDSFSLHSTYTTEMAVTGTIELASPLPSGASVFVTPLSFSFSDGQTTITNFNATDSTFEFHTDVSGSITDWTVSVRNDRWFDQVGDTLAVIYSSTTDISVGNSDLGSFQTCTTLVMGGTGEICVRDANWGENQTLQGSWSVVPVPGAVWLFGSGLIGLIGIARRKEA